MNKEHDALGLPWKHDEDTEVIEDADGRALIPKPFTMDKLTPEQANFLVRACNSHHSLDQATQGLELERDNLELDLAEAETIMHRSLQCAATKDCDECQIDGEPLQDALSFLKTHGWEEGKPPEKFGAWVRQRRQEQQEAEDCVKLLAEFFLNHIDRNGLIELCGACNKSDGCNPDENDCEPCDAFIEAEKRYEKFAPVRKVLKRIGVDIGDPSATMQ